MADILFKTDDYVFSYRVGGLLIHNGKVLMQKAVDMTDTLLSAVMLHLAKQPQKRLEENLRKK